MKTKNIVPLTKLVSLPEIDLYEIIGFTGCIKGVDSLDRNTSLLCLKIGYRPPQL